MSELDDLDALETIRQSDRGNGSARRGRNGRKAALAMLDRSRKKPLWLRQLRHQRRKAVK
jgi:hypothetical protein